MSAPSFLWYDLETFGLDPKTSRISQFAALRTDVDFVPIGKPIIHYCKPSDDFLPSVEAALITKITPQKALREGISERDLMAVIAHEFSQPNTCVLGFNNLRFDDEFIRYGLYRHFYDPYAREWQNGCSRFDIIDVVRMARALRPEGIHWPVDENGKPSNRLELITALNNIDHHSAHDALSDVTATIATAKLLRDKQPKLWDFCFSHRDKHSARRLLALENPKPVVHVSGMFGAQALALVLPICAHPQNANAVIVANLADDPQALLECDYQQLAWRVFSKPEDLPADCPRIFLKGVHLNKCPVLAPLNTLDEKSAQRLGIDLNLQLKNANVLISSLKNALASKVAAAFSEQQFAANQDPEQQLYDDFIGNNDKQYFAKINQSRAEDLGNLNPHFGDARLNALWQRYLARYCPHLSAQQQQDWQQLRRARLLEGADGFLSYAQFQAQLLQAAEKHQDNPQNKAILAELAAYASELCAHL